MKAIILCAGKGTRLQPLTLNKPKPLLEINSQSILERTIHQLRLHNITDILVLTGYKAEKIESLSEKLGFQTLYFPNFENTNSAATLAFASDFLVGDTLLINGDSYSKNGEFLKSLTKDSTLIAQHIAKTTAITWGFEVDKNHHLLKIETDCKGGLCECGISFISAKDIESFKHALQTCEPQDYYENAILQTLPSQTYRVLEVQDSVYEIDSLKDALNASLLTPQEFASQCSTNGKAVRLGGFTNYNFKIELNGTKVLRIPGIGTESFVDREAESKIIALIPSEISAQTTFYYDYIKTTTFLDGFLDQTQSNDLSTPFLESLVKTLKKLHSIPMPKNFSPICFRDEIYKYESLSPKKIVTPKERDFILSIANRLQEDAQVLNHRDLLRGNVMYNGKEVRLVDFEYSGFCSKLWDIANFICEFDVPKEKVLEFIQIYGGITEREVYQARILVHYIWGLWYIVNGVKQEEERHLSHLYQYLKDYS